MPATGHFVWFMRKTPYPVWVESTKKVKQRPATQREMGWRGKFKGVLNTMKSQPSEPSETDKEREILLKQFRAYPDEKKLVTEDCVAP